MSGTAKRIIVIIIGLILIAIACLYLLNSSRRRHSGPAVDTDVFFLCTDEVKESANKTVDRWEMLSDWRLLLVNPWNRIPDDYKVKTAEIEGGYLIDERVKGSLAKMLSDCREAGYSPQIISTFRTRELQQYLYDHTANKQDTAYPGTSEHECGLAADIINSASAGWADPLIDKQETMPAQKWLMEHCSDYGFIQRYPADKEDITGIVYEPWHYRYVGEEHARMIMDRGICLEEYLGRETDTENERIGV